MNDEPRNSRSHPLTVDVVVPVFNESRDLDESIRRLRCFLDDSFPFEAAVTIADNASTDTTWDVACRLQREVSGVRALHLDRKGRGRALRTAWSLSEAEILVYMDVDLSTGLDALLPLIAPLASGHSQLAIGTRLGRGSRVVRGPKRELISRTYNALLRILLHTRFTDAQCGFKAIRSAEARELLPAVEDNDWFFDTELLVLAERNGLRIHEVPVDWSDDPDSRVHIRHTAMADLRGIARLLRSFSGGGGYVESLESLNLGDDLAELRRFAGLGVVNPILYLISYLLLFLVLGGSMNVYLANVVALVLCDAGTFLAHRAAGHRRRSAPAARATIVSAVFATCISVVATTWCLDMARALDRGSVSAEISALAFGSAVAAGLSFLIRRASALHVYLRRRSPGERRGNLSSPTALVTEPLPSP